MARLVDADLPPHAGGLHLSHDEHKAYYQTVEEFATDINPPDWVSDEQRELAIANDSVWVIQWYPHTPIGFNRMAAYDLCALMEAVNDDR